MATSAANDRLWTSRKACTESCHKSSTNLHSIDFDTNQDSKHRLVYKNNKEKNSVEKTNCSKFKDMTNSLAECTEYSYSRDYLQITDFSEKTKH